MMWRLGVYFKLPTLLQRLNRRRRLSLGLVLTECRLPNRILALSSSWGEARSPIDESGLLRLICSFCLIACR